MSLLRATNPLNLRTPFAGPLKATRPLRFVSNPNRIRFDEKAILSALDRGARKALSTFGAYVRVKHRDLLNRPARQKRIAEMTPAELQDYKLRKRIAKQKGEPLPKRPYVSSKPGEPPRKRIGTLRRFSRFAYDKSRRSVVVGPEIFASAVAPGIAPASLEYGGRSVARKRKRGGLRQIRIAKRPSITPAYNLEKHKLPGLIRNSITA